MDKNYHYQIMARAINYIRDHFHDQPSLEQIASEQNMSASHFQRIFTQWVGISPKKYVEHLTLAYAKPALADKIGTIQTAHGSGLSGASRLYDLVLKWEAVTPGEFAKGGEGAVFEYGEINTRFGQAIGVLRNGRLASIEFSENVQCFKTRWPKAKFVNNPDALKPIEDGLATLNGELNLSLIGTAFQLQIWRALLTIPEGKFASYGQIASAINRPKAARAIGTAVGQNPIALLIPCHRVIRATGDLGGYHWGMERKAAIIAFEAARSF